MSYDLPPELTVEADGPVRIVTLNRPEQLNAISASLHRALAIVWRQLAADTEARAVVLTGAGTAFSAGGDLDWISAFEHDHVARDESLREGAEIVEELLRFPLPVIAAVNGPAVGLGCSISILSDVSLLADSAYLCDPHVAVGLVAGDGGAAFWPLLGPILRSREFLFTADRIPADVAVELGLATRVVPAASLRDEAVRVAHKIAKQPAYAVQATKRVVNMHLSRALAGALQAGFAAEQISMQTPEHLSRVAAMRAKAAK